MGGDGERSERACAKLYVGRAARKPWSRRRAYKARAPAGWPARAIVLEIRRVSHGNGQGRGQPIGFVTRHRRQLEGGAVAEDHVRRERDLRLVACARRIARR